MSKYFNASKAGAVRLGLSIALAATLPLHAALAAPTDIVSQQSPLRDALARLAADGALSADPSQLLEYRLLTKAAAASLLEQGLGLSGSAPVTLKTKGEAAAVRTLLIGLRPELLLDHIDVDGLLKTLSKDSASYLGSAEPEARIDTGGSKNASGSNFTGNYRATVLGDLGANTAYAVSVSDQAEEDRRDFTNDVGPQSFSALTQAYLKFNGARGLSFLIGRTDENWGPGIEGGALLSDNAGPLDELNVSFPFSLGGFLGRNWKYTQLASTYDEDGQRKYLQARRVERNFSSHWSADYQEALKSDSSNMLVRAPLPFLIAKGIDLANSESNSEFVANVGLNYSANKNFRTYGQLLINDIKSPFRGHFLGFDAGQGGNTPQRLGYLAGAGYDSQRGTSAAIEYSTADPTTYQDSNPSLAWTKGAHDYLGLPDGANFKQIFGMMSQQLEPKVTIYLEDRYRTRFSDSFPAPTAQDFAASAKYQFDRRNSFSLTFHDYVQHEFPYLPGSPQYPSSGYIPVSEGNQGTNTTIHELDAGYELVF